MFNCFARRLMLVLTLGLAMAGPAAAQGKLDPVSRQILQEALALNARQNAKVAAIEKEYSDVSLDKVVIINLPMKAEELATSRKQMQRFQQYLQALDAALVDMHGESKAFAARPVFDTPEGRLVKAQLTRNMAAIASGLTNTTNVSRDVLRAMDDYVTWASALQGKDFSNGKSGELKPTAHAQLVALVGKIETASNRLAKVAEGLEVVADEAVKREEGAVKRANDLLAK